MQEDRFIERLRLAIGDEPAASFARRCRLPEATLRSYFNGYKPKYDTLVAMADAAGVSVEWLATGRGAMRPAHTGHVDMHQVHEPQATYSVKPAPDLTLLGVGPAMPIFPQDRAATPPASNARRWQAIMQIVEGIEDEAERSAFLDELHARARQTAELSALRRAVGELQQAIKKGSR